MSKFDVVVIGTGFCASNLTSFLARNALTIQVIEPSSVQPPIVFTKTTESVFSEDQANKTSRLGGGSSIWGKAITHPNDKNWFIPKGNGEWESLYERLSMVALPSEMNIPRPKRHGSRFAKKYFPNLKKRFLEEIGLYAGTELGEENNFALPQIDKNILMLATVKDLKANADHFLVTVCGADGLISKIQSRYLVLACGTFLNACYFSLINGQKDFPLSNHFAADFGRIELTKPITVKDCVQTYASGENAFSTFASLRSKTNSNWEPNSSIRLQATPLAIGRRAMVSALLKLEILYLFNRVIPFLYSVLKGSRLVESLRIRVIADQNISEKNGMRIVLFHNGVFHVEITLTIENCVRADAHRAVSEFIEIVKTSRIVSSVDLFNEEKVFWDDPAHYFGTTPIGLRKYESSLTSDSESRLHPGLYIIGNSSIPVGSHGHPTLISMQLSMIAAMSILTGAKGE